MPDRLSEARAMLAELGLPPQQQNKISGLTLLALCRVTLDSDWSQARRESLTIRKGIMDYVGEVLGNPYAENSREQFRRKVLHQFVQAGICLYNPDDATLATNSQKNHYAMSNEALVAIRRYGTKGWPAARDKFLAQAGGSKGQDLISTTLINKINPILSKGKLMKVDITAINIMPGN